MSDLPELFKSIGEVCSILGRLTGPLHRLAHDLEHNALVQATPKKAKRWTTADNTAFAEAREKHGNDAERIHAALPKKQLQEIQNKLDKLIKSETRKRKLLQQQAASEKAEDSSDARPSKKVTSKRDIGEDRDVAKDSDNESPQAAAVQALALAPTAGQVKGTAVGTHAITTKRSSVVSPSKSADKSKQATEAKPGSKDSAKMFIKEELQASPIAPSPDLGKESDSDGNSDGNGDSSDEFG